MKHALKTTLAFALALSLSRLPAAAGPFEDVAAYNDGVVAYNRGDYAAAFRIWQALAVQGYVGAQLALGDLYLNGIGVPQFYAEAAKWFRSAAEQGDGVAQMTLGDMYVVGRGVPQDYVQGHKWLNLAVANLLAAANQNEAIKKRDALAAKMAAAQIAEAQRLAREWAPTPAAQSPRAGPPAMQLVGGGSGFYISRAGDILTNYHVIDGCSEVRLGDAGRLSVVVGDKVHDLAILRGATAVSSVAEFRVLPARAGETVVAAGFPLQGLLAAEVNITTGNVSATAGLRGDAGQLQITAPVQPGNSGGPLLDQTGAVIGVVVGKLDAVKVAGAIGDIPQNVNFAVKGPLGIELARSAGVAIEIALQRRTIDVTAVAEQASRFTVYLTCWR